jgi:hypothetical protein
VPVRWGVISGSPETLLKRSSHDRLEDVMEEIRREGEQVVVSLSLDELRLIGATMNEALNGGYAIPGDIWEELVGQPVERAESLVDALLAVVES